MGARTDPRADVYFLNSSFDLALADRAALADLIDTAVGALPEDADAGPLTEAYADAVGGSGGKKATIYQRFSTG
jgi:hypothetical protein